MNAKYEYLSRLPGFLDFEAFKLFQNLSQIYRTEYKILEIGVFCGRSLIGLALAFPKLQSLVGIDPFYADFKSSPASLSEAQYLIQASHRYKPGKRRLIVEQAISGLDQFESNLSTRITVSPLTQSQFLHQPIKFAKYNLFHVDGEHSFSAITEFLDWLPKLSEPNSLVIIDDFLNPGFPGISEAVHTHKYYNKRLLPVFYGFNKAVFIYQPADLLIPRRLSAELKSCYRSSNYIIRDQPDGSVMIQLK